VHTVLVNLSNDLLLAYCVYLFQRQKRISIAYGTHPCPREIRRREEVVGKVIPLFQGEELTPKHGMILLNLGARILDGLLKDKKSSQELADWEVLITAIALDFGIDPTGWYTDDLLETLSFSREDIDAIVRVIKLHKRLPNTLDPKEWEQLRKAVDELVSEVLGKAGL